MTPGMYSLRPETVSRLRAAVPFPVARLYDEDDLGRALRLVDESAERSLFRFNTGALLEVEVRGPQVVRVEFHEGDAAVRRWITHGLRLPAERAALIRATLLP